MKLICALPVKLKLIWLGLEHLNFQYFQYIIGDLRDAGWSVRRVRENDSISDNDLYHVFKKVDIDNNQEITTMVGAQ